MLYVGTSLDKLLFVFQDVHHSQHDAGDVSGDELMIAMTRGHRMASVQRCEITYRCPFSGQQLREIAGQDDV